MMLEIIMRTSSFVFREDVGKSLLKCNGFKGKIV